MKKQLTSQGKNFVFSPENLQEAENIIARYPKGRQASALIPLLDLAQRQAGRWLPKEALEYIASYLGLPLMHVYEVASFYSMFNLAPVGQYFIQVCTTTPCQLRGAIEILKTCESFIAGSESCSKDGGPLFSVCEVECLGACVNGPVVQINDDYYEDLNTTRIKEILSRFKEGKQVQPGSQIGRQGSAPEGGFKKSKSSSKESSS